MWLEFFHTLIFHTENTQFPSLWNEELVPFCRFPASFVSTLRHQFIEFVTNAQIWGKTALSGICLARNKIWAIVLVAVTYQLGICILFDKSLFMQTRGLLLLKAKCLFFFPFSNTKSRVWWGFMCFKTGAFVAHVTAHRSYSESQWKLLCPDL